MIDLESTEGLNWTRIADKVTFRITPFLLPIKPH
jgi:hypothetical protein